MTPPSRVRQDEYRGPRRAETRGRSRIRKAYPKRLRESFLTTPRELDEAFAMRCLQCKTEIELGSGQRVEFRDSCSNCAADLHVCMQCQHRDSSAYNGCRESSAERVSDPERANRCEWFSPADDSPIEGAAEPEDARSRLEELFKK